MKYTVITKYTIAFALLLPTIQGTQLYILFDVFNPILLIMPVVMGSTLGFLVGLNRYKVNLKIQELKNIQLNLEKQVALQTQELQDKNDALNKSLLIDPLTGLGNRIKLKNTLEQENKKLSTEYKSLSLFMIDIDYFKNYNDYYGHLEGDKVLQDLGDFFKTQMIETQNVIMRFGGEEFIAVLPNSDKEIAKEIAQKFLDGIKALNIEHIKSKNHSIITVSIGIHTTEYFNITSSNELIKLADEALYNAKDRGRDQFCHTQD